MSAILALIDEYGAWVDAGVIWLLAVMAVGLFVGWVIRHDAA